MKLEYIGHACFRLTAADGTRVITDPYDDSVGIAMLPLEAELVTMSHGHHDHCCEDMLRGAPEKREDTLCDVLYHDRVKNKTFVVRKQRPGAREARLGYTRCQCVCDGANVLSLVRVRLYTGRTHQIRAQFASRKLPLLGDGKYGGGDNRCACALWSYRLRFSHPKSGADMTFAKLPPEGFPWRLFSMEDI